MTRRRWHPSADTRREILNEAERQFRERGFNKTTIADVAAATGMSPANIYKHFTSKLGLVDGITGRNLQETTEALDALPVEGRASDRLKAIVRLVTTRQDRMIRENPFIFEIFMATLFNNPPSADRFGEDLRGRFESVIRDGIAAGEFADGDPVATSFSVTETLMAVLDPISVLRLLKRDPAIDRTVRAERLLDFVITALRA
ncbi:TetR/AcrR family transcriptional regulator [Consotaella aegiceratis]|uniref:TetR/AcrR family transcriptional regulator n=1 Tax=Consotaella aegiceratis TaxID=3097961 RepID=UPI002F3FAF5B